MFYSNLDSEVRFQDLDKKKKKHIYADIYDYLTVLFYLYIHFCKIHKKILDLLIMFQNH
jgi:hypothetical protein